MIPVGFQQVFGQFLDVIDVVFDDHYVYGQLCEGSSYFPLNLIRYHYEVMKPSLLYKCSGVSVRKSFTGGMSCRF